MGAVEASKAVFSVMLNLGVTEMYGFNVDDHQGSKKLLTKLGMKFIDTEIYKGAPVNVYYKALAN